jgi:hypothetical protein
MPQPNARIVAPLAVLLTVLSIAGCSSAPEQPILNQFFTASKLRDNTSLQNFAIVTFDPRTEGIVSSFDITSVGAEQRKPLNVKLLAKTVDDVKAEDDEYTKRRQTFYMANQEAVVRALKAEREKAALKGKDAEVQAAWTKLREEGSVMSKKMSEARSKLASESAVVELSLSDPRNPVDYKKHDGELAAKEITLSASVKAPSGQSSQKTLIVTMERAVIKADKEINGRWIITGVKDQSTPAGTKSS